MQGFPLIHMGHLPLDVTSREESIGVGFHHGYRLSLDTTLVKPFSTLGQTLHSFPLFAQGDNTSQWPPIPRNAIFKTESMDVPFTVLLPHGQVSAAVPPTRADQLPPPKIFLSPQTPTKFFLSPSVNPTLRRSSCQRANMFQPGAAPFTKI